MKEVVKTGDERQHRYTVKEEDVARFENGLVHPVCSTFALAREMEWASRLFVLDMCEADEEGIGTHVHVEHIAPAAVGEQLLFRARIDVLSGNALSCSICVSTISGREVARGSTGQKILKREKLARIFSKVTS
jgi:fluoroacetyl-CoA thioesterase